MEQHDVDEDRCEHRQGERDKTIRQEERTGDQFQGKDHQQILGGKQRAHELAGDSGRRRHRNKVEEAV